MGRLGRFIKNHKAAFIAFLAIGSVALASSGSAMWLLALRAMQEAKGNVNIGTVSDAKVSFSDVSFLKESEDDRDYNRISFDAAKDDDEGRVRYDGNNGEHLSVTITGKLNAYHYVKSCTYKLSVPECIKEGINKQYIALDTGNGRYEEAKDYIAKPQPFSFSPIKDESGNDTGAASFSVTVGFIWGEYFKGLNPSVYYDNDEYTGNKTIDEITSEFNEFRRIMYGYPEGSYVPDNPDDIVFTVTLTALTQ